MTGITVKLILFPTRTYLGNLRVLPTTTMEELRVMVESRLMNDNGPMQRLGHWYWAGDEGMLKDRSVGLIEIKEADLTSTISAMGIDDNSTIYLTGVLSKPAPLSGDVSFRQHLEQQTIEIGRLRHDNALLASGMKQLVDEIKSLKEVQHQQTICLQSQDSYAKYHGKMLAKILATVPARDEPMASASPAGSMHNSNNVGASNYVMANNNSDSRHNDLHANLAQNIVATPHLTSAVSSSITVIGEADKLLRENRSSPLTALWRALSQSDNSALAVAVACDPRCGLQRTSTDSEMFAQRSDVISPTIPGRFRTTPLTLAAFANRSDVVKALLDEGADVRATDTMGLTALHWAAQFAQIPLLKLLINSGADVNSSSLDNTTPLLYAHTKLVSTALIWLFIQEGANVNAASNYGNTPLFIAIRSSSFLDPISMLIAGGANVNARNADLDAPLHHAVGYGHNFELLALLIDSGADINAVNKDGNTPLHIAASLGKTAFTNFLTSKGARTDIKNLVGKSPLDFRKRAQCPTTVGTTIGIIPK